MAGADVATVQWKGSSEAERDASCCALCDANSQCTFWVRAKHEGNVGNCWLKKDFRSYHGSSIRLAAHKREVTKLCAPCPSAFRCLDIRRRASSPSRVLRALLPQPLAHHRQETLTHPGGRVRVYQHTKKRGANGVKVGGSNLRFGPACESVFQGLRSRSLEGFVRRQRPDDPVNVSSVLVATGPTASFRG